MKRAIYFTFIVSLLAFLTSCDGKSKPAAAQEGQVQSEDAEIPVALPSAEEAPERHIKLEGEPNFRDLGGYETADGRTVKWREVFRTGELGKLTDADVETLEGLELRTVVNFLLPEEIAQHGEDRLPAGVELVNDPITGERSAELSLVAQSAISTANFDALPAEINYDIHAILMEDAMVQYARLLRTIADPEARPIAFHCSHGVHRTGTASAILLSALGVPWETVREDYVLTNEVRADTTAASLAKLRDMAAAAQGIAPEAVDMTNVEAFYVLEGAYIDAALETAEAKYGSMDGYIREGLGLSEAEIDALKSALLE